MSIKKKLGMGILTAAMGIALIGGGTFAYFSDTEVSHNTFAAGTLDLSVKPSTIIDVKNIKPGDTMKRVFTLKNDGSLDIKEVFLTTQYSQEGVKKQGYKTPDFGDHIRVNFLKNEDKSGRDPNNVIESVYLSDLKNMKPDLVERVLRKSRGGEASGLKAGTSDKLVVEFEFVDNGKDQNAFQGAKLKLKWTFDATQTEGEKR